MPHGRLTIGDLAGESLVSAKTIRFYEAAGVLPRPARGSNGYRLHAADTLEMLAFIKQAAGLGLTLAEIKAWRGRRPVRSGRVCPHIEAATATPRRAKRR